MAGLNGRPMSDDDDGLPEYLSPAEGQPAWSSPAGFDVTSQGDNFGPSRRLPTRHEDLNLYLDLNSQAPEFQTSDFPHLGSYQDLLRSGSQDLEHAGRGNAGHGGRSWRPPRQSGSGGGGRGAGGNGGGRGAGGHGSGRGAGGGGGRGAIGNGGGHAAGGKGSGRGAVGSQTPAVGGGGRGAANGGGRGAANGGGRGTAMSSGGRGATVTTNGWRGTFQGNSQVAPTADEADDGMDEEEDDAMGNDAMMNDNTMRCSWTAENTTIFCDLCIDEIRAGNVSNGRLTRIGYKNLATRFFEEFGLRHTAKQLKNKWGSLKGLYQFWMYLNNHTGFGRNPDGSVQADEDFWQKNTKNKAEWKKLRYGPPDNLAQLEEMFQNVAVDGSRASMPGEYIARDEYDGEEEQDEGEDGSPMSTNSNKRANSTCTTATSPRKKTKSPMVKMVKGILDTMKDDSESSQREAMALSIKKALELVVQSGASQSSVEYFMATQLFVKAEHREMCFNFDNPEDRLLWLQRWCRMKNLS